MKDLIDRKWMAKALSDDYLKKLMDEVCRTFRTRERWESLEVSIRLYDDGIPYLGLLPKKTNPQ